MFDYIGQVGAIGKSGDRRVDGFQALVNLLAFLHHQIKIVQITAGGSKVLFLINFRNSLGLITLVIFPDLFNGDGHGGQSRR